MKARITIDSKGRVMLPSWVCKALLKHAGCKGESERHQRRVIKREFTRLIRLALKDEKGEE